MKKVSLFIRMFMVMLGISILSGCASLNDTVDNNSRSLVAESDNTEIDKTMSDDIEITVANEEATIYDDTLSVQERFESEQENNEVVEEEVIEPEMSEYEVEDRLRPYLGQPVENILSEVEELGYTAKYKDINNGQDFTALLLYYKPGDENYSADDFFIEEVENVNTDRKTVDILVAMKIIEPEVTEPEPIVKPEPVVETEAVERAAVITQDEPETPVAQSGGGGTVYITNTGEKYHNDGCRSLRKSKIPISRSEAIAQGYGPCGICHP